MYFFAHSVGDTQAIIDIVAHLKSQDLPKAPETINIVLLGEAAHNKFFGKNPVPGMDGVVVRSMATDPELNFGMDVFKQDKLNRDQQKSLNKFLQANVSKDESVLIGNPSLPNCQVPFDIIEFLNTDRSIRPIVYNDYLFEDPKSVLHQSITAREMAPLWVSLCDVAVATEKAKGRFEKELGSKAALFVAGHRIIDNALAIRSSEEQVILTEKNNKIRGALGIEPEQQFVFFSGCKETDLDMAVFEAALDQIEQYPTAQLVLGTHPGHANLPHYADQMIGLLLKKDPAVAQRVKIILPSKLEPAQQDALFLIAGGVATSCVKQPDLKMTPDAVDLSGGALGAACDAAIGAVPGQLLFDTALRGGQSASGANPFMYVNGVGSGFGSFAALFEKQARAGQPTRAECGVPAQSMVEIMAEKMLAP